MDNLESTYHQLSKALCGKENATCEEILQAVEQLKLRPDLDLNRVLTLDEIKKQRAVWIEISSDSFLIDEEDVQQVQPVIYCAIGHPGERFVFFDEEGEQPWLDQEDYNSEWRCWLRKPTDEERAAAKWEV